MIKHSTGRFDKYISFQKSTKTSDGTGGYTAIYAVDFYAWANVRGLSVSESYQRGLDAAVKNYEIKIAYESDITPNRQHRIVYGSSTLAINGVINEEEESRYYVITASELK